MRRETIVRWVNKRTGPPATTVSTAAEYKAAAGEQELALLAYFDAFEVYDDDACMHSALPAHEQASAFAALLSLPVSSDRPCYQQVCMLACRAQTASALTWTLMLHASC